MGLYNIELGFWNGLLVTIGILVILYGVLVASSMAVAAAWFLLVSVALLILYVAGKRGVRRLIRGGGRR